jgi:hypothetical protein
VNDPFEAQVASWLRDAARPDADELQRLLVFAQDLPPRRSRRPMWFAAPAVAAVVVVVLLALAGMPRVPAPAGTPSYPIASGDPRFAKCGGTAKGVIAAFAMAHASDYQAYIPAMGKAPGLETAVPAFVVVFDATHHWVTYFPGFASGSFPAATPIPNHFDVCVWVGDVSNGDFVSYGGVDIIGMRTSLPGASPIVYPPAGRAPVANCRAERWPQTVISCDTAFAVGTPAAARISQARIWLTSLSSVTAALRPAQAVGVAPDTEVWLIVFDGSSLCCPVREGDQIIGGSEVISTRWIVAVDATGRLRDFVYYLDWTRKQVPNEFPEILAN